MSTIGSIVLLMPKKLIVAPAEDRKGNVLTQALQLLEETGQVRCEKDETGKQGRSAHRWFVVEATEKTEKGMGQWSNLVIPFIP